MWEMMKRERVRWRIRTRNKMKIKRSWGPFYSLVLQRLEDQILFAKHNFSVTWQTTINLAPCTQTHLGFPTYSCRACLWNEPTLCWYTCIQIAVFTRISEETVSSIFTSTLKTEAYLTIQVTHFNTLHCYWTVSIMPAVLIATTSNDLRLFSVQATFWWATKQQTWEQY
jgi:hypothetical protein